MNTMARVKQIADERELSLYQLAHLCDVSYNTLKQTEDRRGQLTVNTIEKICIGLRIPMSEFFSQ